MKKRVDVVLRRGHRREPARALPIASNTGRISLRRSERVRDRRHFACHDQGRRWCHLRCLFHRCTATSRSLGYRFSNLAYSPDISALPEASAELLRGLDVWIVDALRLHAAFQSFSVKQALEWAARLKPKRTILTHMTSDLDYETLRKELPAGVEPAYDGMTISFT